MKTEQEIALISATWWADKVANPKFDNGDNTYSGFMSMGLASLLIKPIDSSIREKFIDALSKEIVRNLEKSKYHFTLDVDYAPDLILRNSAEIAGLPINNFPWKTVMWIDKNHISVRYGYGAVAEILYANKIHWKERIESAKISIEEYSKADAFSWIHDEEERKCKVNEFIEEIKNDIDKYESLLKLASD